MMRKVIALVLALSVAGYAIAQPRGGLRDLFSYLWDVDYHDMIPRFSDTDIGSESDKVDSIFCNYVSAAGAGDTVIVADSTAAAADTAYGLNLTNQQVILLGPDFFAVPENNVNMYSSVHAAFFAHPDGASESIHYALNSYFPKTCSVDSIRIWSEFVTAASGDSILFEYGRGAFGEANNFTSRSSQASRGFDSVGNTGAWLTLIPTYAHAAQDSIQWLYMETDAATALDLRIHHAQIFLSDWVR